MEQYTQLANDKNPLYLGITIDQSGSTSQADINHKSKADIIAEVANASIEEMQTMCISATNNAIKDKIFLNIIGYGQLVQDMVQSPISQIPILRKVTETQSFDGVDIAVEKSIFIEPKSSGTTPMHEAFSEMKQNILTAINDYDDLPAAVVINISDGIPDDMSLSETEAIAIRDTATQDGSTLLMNAHIDHTGQQPILFPISEDELPDEYAKFMFRISSEVPASYRERYNAEHQGGAQIRPGAKAMIYNASSVELLQIIKLGTRTV